jgi:hypothetical protein
VLIRS